MNYKKLEYLGLTPSELREIKLIFDVFDSEEEGKVERLELLETLKEMQKRDLHKSQSTLIMHLLEDVEDDYITFEMFAEIFAIKTPWNRILGRSKKLSKENLDKLFRLLGNEKGITFDSLKRVAKELDKMNIKDDALREVIKNGDSNKDGILSYSDFSMAVLNLDLSK